MQVKSTSACSSECIKYMQLVLLIAWQNYGKAVNSDGPQRSGWEIEAILTETFFLKLTHLKLMRPPWNRTQQSHNNHASKKEHKGGASRWRCSNEWRTSSPRLCGRGRSRTWSSQPRYSPPGRMSSYDSKPVFESLHRNLGMYWLLGKLPGSTEMAASYAFEKEDHTLGNALRYIIMRKYVTSFVAFSIASCLIQYACTALWYV